MWLMRPRASVISDPEGNEMTVKWFVLSLAGIAGMLTSTPHWKALKQPLLELLTCQLGLAIGWMVLASQ